ncbi:undecaprenyl-phosphate galactose phosphotransferase WbaP [Castellaniella sp.]|uniref:undecaprenyl-phosphate galactose phosphotransferase WbaP n=1 Tax=Castellaniella sp. TaxID=1955812 RepID=UPI002AFF88C7|nr:undecaprenyl-phosphate galactose phosphotransferase WbaP [Castellaniella sp.]
MIMLLADGMMFVLGPLGAALMLQWVMGDWQVYMPPWFLRGYALLHVLLASACLLWFLAWRGHYVYRKPSWSVVRDFFLAIFFAGMAELAVMGFLKWPVSRYAWVLAWGFTFVLLLLERSAVRRLLVRLGLWHKQCVIIGAGPNALDAYCALTYERSMGFDIQYFYGVGAETAAPVDGVELLSTESDLWARTEPGDTQYVLALEYGQEDLRDDWIRLTTENNCRAVSVVPAIRGIPLNSTDVSFIFSHDVMILHIRENLQKRTSRALKRGFDILGSAALLLVLSPLLGWLWWKIGRDGGSPLYGHMRVGYQGRIFPCLKFRSMVLNADEVLQQLLERDPIARAEWESNFKLKDDPRITMLGRFIRRTSLDELPQLWNVFRGDMSLVGPRPVVEAELKFYGKYVSYYKMAKPGITGLWQVSGRSDVDYETRVYFDAWYVKNWSIWNDIVILFKTVSAVLKRDGAY